MQMQAADSGRLGKIIALRGLYGKSGGKNFPKSWRNYFNISGGGILPVTDEIMGKFIYH